MAIDSRAGSFKRSSVNSRFMVLMISLTGYSRSHSDSM